MAEEIITVEIDKDYDDTPFILKFLTTYNVPFPPDALDSIDNFYDFRGESERYHDAVDEITDEVFHILFNDIGFLQEFNRLCSGYISQASGIGAEHTTRKGTLKRTPIPVWARRAVFHRDKGECRNCKRSLAFIINQLDRECYDHIVPLALNGANDVTNLQLLCESCNLAKLAKDVPASRYYQRAIRP